MRPKDAVGEGEGPGISWDYDPSGDPSLCWETMIFPNPATNSNPDSLSQCQGQPNSPPWFLHRLCFHNQEDTSPQFPSTKLNPPFRTQSNATFPKEQKGPHHPAQYWFHCLCAPLLSVLSLLLEFYSLVSRQSWTPSIQDAPGPCWLYFIYSAAPWGTVTVTVPISQNWGQRVSDLLKATQPMSEIQMNAGAPTGPSGDQSLGCLECRAVASAGRS